ncbi:MAG: hypothetical protein US94_C0012G0008 [Berkelbacteria bacterium GW2011_GWB1_38_5]|uniref:Solute-binding protein family 5 domain-containing protein n=2 Tax=Candidatus Berkelbacteria TaxID=1618330 RepID=A0A0G0LFX0_9BACT|nr:MAG: hypothetical protein US94_C0012G0008 [Berkelbacteria bacterium GW2011_GWB1_38_5]KKQ90758.1 MAG: hypothetical protein UT15_C0005G0008 [Berkelbacteria bacterium GW2011_GWA1_39_10]
MKFIKSKKILNSIKKYPWRDTLYSFKHLPRVFSRIEKIILLGLFATVAISFVFLGYRNWLSGTRQVPATGGEFVEGIVGESKDLDKHLPRLIYAGLTKYDNQKNIVADMAQSWEIKNNGKLYEFKLRDNFSSEDLASQILSKNIWKDIEISTPDSSTITFSFKQPFSPFLYASTEPIFDYGPYRISKETKDEVELTARDDYYAGKPYINKVVVKLFNSQDDLLKAARRKDIYGLGIQNNQDMKDYNKFEVHLPRDLYLFFNLSNKSLQDINIRRALKENSSPNKELDLRLVTSDNAKNVELAKAVVDKWGKAGVKVTLDVKDNVTLQKTTIPKRDYDLLLYGLDYGEDPDPYPFWHSSQIKEDGRNLSNFKNIKADKLMEDARQEFDFKKREEKYAEFQQIIDQEIPAYVVEHQDYFYLVSNKVYGIEKIVAATEGDRFLNVALWYIHTKRIKK